MSGELGLRVAGGRLLAGHGPLGRLVFQHGVGGDGDHQSPVHHQDARLGEFADVLRTLVSVARILRLGHENLVIAHGFRSPIGIVEVAR
jgi:hypothetical protein